MTNQRHGRKLLGVLFSLLVVVGCRPSLEASPTPGPSSIAGDLMPEQAMSVGIHLPGTAGAMYSSIVALNASGSLAAANVTVSGEPFAGEDQSFIGAGRTDAVDLFVAESAAALISNAAGNDLVLLASLQRTQSWRLLTLASGDIQGLDQLQGTTVYVDGLVGDELPLLIALNEAGVESTSVSFVYAEDPGAPFDSASLLDGAVSAAFVHTFDGYVRLAQAFDPNTGGSVGESFYRELPVASLGAGLGIWASAASIESDDAKIAVAATLVGLAQSMAQCRDDVEACAALVADSGLTDLGIEAVAWGLNALNASLWPNPQGLFEIDRATLQEEVDAAVAVGLITTVSVDSFVNDEILTMASQYWPAGVDRNGSSWVPLELVIP